MEEVMDGRIERGLVDTNLATISPLYNTAQNQ